jgi:alkylhydroperoxidase family enzyme
MGEPRVPLLPLEESRKAAEQVKVLPQMAELNIFRTLLHQPELAKAIQDLLVTLLFRGRLDPRLRELIIMRIGWVTGSDYEWTQHWRVATQMGVAEEDLLDVRNWQVSSRLGDAERAVLAATDETLESGSISPGTWAACERHLGGREALLELVAAIGTWRMISSVLRSLDIPLEEGVASWPPDGTRPEA